MTKRIPLFLLSLGLLPAALSAQPLTRCSSSDYYQQQVQLHPEMLQTRALLQQQTEVFAQDQQRARTMAVITIPVVFHVVFENAAENIPDFRLDSQLVALNRDYRKLNSDVAFVPAAWQGLASDCEIQFCLAGTDPQGNFTTGITRTQTNVASFGTNDLVKYTATGGHDIWDRDRYLNIWVCDLNQGLLGYAAMPGSSAAIDGVVIDYTYTGTFGATAPYDKGRTAVHEVGHWLNLEHIWGNDAGACTGSDFCNDTPNQALENYPCHNPGTVITDACSTTAPGIMWMNYMDYTNDACMYMFTADQKIRMQATLATIRSSIASSNTCLVSVPEQEAAAGIRIFPSPSGGQFTITVANPAVQQLSLEVYSMLGQQVYREQLGKLTGGSAGIDLGELSSGVYFIRMDTGSEKRMQKIIIQH